MADDKTETFLIYSFPLSAIILVGSILAAAVSLNYEGLTAMVKAWDSEEYSHGYLIPFIAGFLIWQRKNEIAEISSRKSWAGVLIVLIGVAAFFLGELGTIYTVIQYAFILILIGLALSYLGWPAFKKILPPLFILAFMVPLPNFIFNNLSAELQLISSKIGVAVIRLFGISVYLEGNVIDLGTMKLQVVEACSGLRYLFPLMTLGFIAAYFFQGAFWKRALIFFSSIPITILMNSFRIGVIGVTVEHWGRAAAEGLLHDFEGWFVFMACTALLVLEMWILSRIGKDKKPFQQAFGIDFPEPLPDDVIREERKTPITLYLSSAIILFGLLLSTQLEKREERIIDRESFASFPSNIGEWRGNHDKLEQIYLDVLKLDDHIISDYTRKGDPSRITFYVAYYASQSKGQSAHSPRSCLPGGGWKITDLDQVRVKGVDVATVPLTANRVVIKKGDYTQLVYYWFQGRGRVITNEYMVKWYLFWDAIKRNRTDGALVRLTTFIKPGDTIEAADRRIMEFAQQSIPLLDKYVAN